MYNMTTAIELRFEIRRVDEFNIIPFLSTITKNNFIKQVAHLKLITSGIRLKHDIECVSNHVVVKGTTYLSKEQIKHQIDAMNLNKNIWETPDVTSYGVRYYLAKIVLIWPDIQYSVHKNTSQKLGFEDELYDCVERHDKCRDDLDECKKEKSTILQDNNQKIKDLLNKLNKYKEIATKHLNVAAAAAAAGPTVHPPAFHPKTPSPISEDLTDQTKHVKKIAEDAEKRVKELNEFIIENNPSFLKNKQFWEDLLKTSIDLKRDSKVFKSLSYGKQSPTVINEIRDQFNHSRDFLQELVIHILKHQAAVSNAAIAKAATAKADVKNVESNSKSPSSSNTKKIIVENPVLPAPRVYRRPPVSHWTTRRAPWPRSYWPSTRRRTPSTYATRKVYY